MSPETDEPDEVVDPTPEQYAARAKRADRASRGALAGILGLEAVVMLLVPRTIAFTSGLGPVRTTIVFVIVALLIFGAACTRRSWGIGFGSGLQLVFIATGFLIGTMFLVGGIFAAIWLRILMFRHEVVGSPGGARMLLG
ncbi:DUF4233 domain-containing protein [Jatrophihabitans fulvus]